MAKFHTKERMQKELRMTSEELDLAIKGLLEKGLMESKMIDGIECYRITTVGKQIYHQIQSSPKERN